MERIRLHPGAQMLLALEQDALRRGRVQIAQDLLHVFGARLHARVLLMTAEGFEAYADGDWRLGRLQ